MGRICCQAHQLWVWLESHEPETAAVIALFPRIVKLGARFEASQETEKISPSDVSPASVGLPDILTRSFSTEARVDTLSLVAYLGNPDRRPTGVRSTATSVNALGLCEFEAALGDNRQRHRQVACVGKWKPMSFVTTHCGRRIENRCGLPLLGWHHVAYCGASHHRHRTHGSEDANSRRYIKV